MKKYSYQNLQLANIKGERWKDIPGLEMYFKVSNYGRIKRLEYELEYSDGRIYTKPEKIIKPIMHESPNRYKNDKLYSLTTGVTLQKQKYNFSIARLVYYCFNKPFKLDDPSIVILAKDGNNLHIKPSNLILASISQKQQRIFLLNRKEPTSFDEKARRKAIETLKRLNNKQVSQYSMEGKKIKTFASTVQASRETGISNSHISNRARGVELSAGGFIWRFGDAEKIDVRPMLNKIAERRKRNKAVFGKKVTQYTLDGRRVAVFPTINDASKVTKVSNAEISLVMQKKRASARGFYWQEGQGAARIDLSHHISGEKLRHKNRQRPVRQYTKQGKLLKRFDSIKEAAKAVGLNPTTIIGSLTGRYETAAGYKWEYA